MARSPLTLGTWGEIRTHEAAWDEKAKPTRVRAVAQYRDFDGRTRQVERSGKSKTAAVNALRQALTDRSEAGRQGDLTLMSRFSDAANEWITRIEGLVKDGARSPGTSRTYRSHLNNHILKALGELRLGEVTTPIVDRFLAKTKKLVGVSTARTCRSIISGVMGLAVRAGAIRINPVREVSRIEGGPVKQPRALTSDEQAALRAHLFTAEKAIQWDLPDLVVFMLATGVRIGEALATIWGEFDPDAGTIRITSTLVRIKGEGLARKPTKSRAGKRTLLLPPSCVAVLQRRSVNARFDRPIFPDSVGGFRDPSNTSRCLREVLNGSSALAWITSHVFRKTTATTLDVAGMSARAVADQLGHSRPSMTQDVYLGRDMTNPLAARALETTLAPWTQNHG